METAYPRTLRDAGGRGNFVSAESQLHPGFPATVEGQAAFLRALGDVVAPVPGGRGAGVLFILGAGVRHLSGHGAVALRQPHPVRRQRAAAAGRL